MLHFYTPYKHQKTRDVLMISGDIGGNISLNELSVFYNFAGNYQSGIRK